jgi:two-component system, NtrC family, response regulator AtoC
MDMDTAAATYPTAHHDDAPWPPSQLPVSEPAGLLVNDPAAVPAPQLVRDFAAAPVSVLILGETGAGKEVLARRLHELSGRTGPFVAINCAALTEALLESELFGHEQGSFTGASKTKPGLFEAARGGTIFLDEIGELPTGLQPKLLRAIEAREVLRVGAVRPVAIDVRLVTATHRDLVAEVAARRFRADLYYRIDGVTVRVAPLRADPARIAPLALKFIAAAHRTVGGEQAPTLSAAVRMRLEEHAWPGNVRELKAVCERAVVLARGGGIELQHVVLAAAMTTTPRAVPVNASQHASPTAFELTPAQIRDRDRIVAALASHAGNQRLAAGALCMSRATFTTRLALYRIPRPRDR